MQKDPIDCAIVARPTVKNQFSMRDLEQPNQKQQRQAMMEVASTTDAITGQEIQGITRGEIQDVTEDMPAVQEGQVVLLQPNASLLPAKSRRCFQAGM